MGVCVVARDLRIGIVVYGGAIDSAGGSVLAIGRLIRRSSG